MTMQTSSLRLLSVLIIAGMAAACGQNGSDAVSTQQTADPSAQPTAAIDAGTDATAEDEKATAEQVAEQSGEQKAQPCLSCHSLDNFASFDVPQLEAFMQSMRTGEMAHPPLPDSVSDADVADIADYLAGVEADG